MTYQPPPVSPAVIPENFNFATDIVDYWARNSPSQIAIHWTNQNFSEQRKLTYSYFSRQSRRIATLLTSLGVAQGETCIVILPRIPEWWEIATACLRAGIILCPCTTLLVDKDIEFRLQISKATTFVGDEVAISKILRVWGNCPQLRTVIQIGGNPSQSSGVIAFHKALSVVPGNIDFVRPKSLRAQSPGLIFFTSGTTGPPKMVLHSQISYPLASVLTGVHWLQLNTSSVYWNLAEQGWGKAAWAYFATWNCGGTQFVHDDRLPFEPQRTLAVLAKFPITTLCAPPTAYRQLVLKEYRRSFQNPGMKSLVHACSAGEPMNDSVIMKWKDLTGVDIYDGYGQTETILLCANQATNPIRYGSMGKPIPGIPLVVIDANGNVTKNNDEGDIAIEISQKNAFFGLFDGYISPSTRGLDRRIKSFSNGRQYYLTGDRARRDSEGYFWFVGRGDDVINSSGYRIGKQFPFTQRIPILFLLHPVLTLKRPV